MLKDVFRSSSMRGFDVQPALVRLARRRGIVARVLDLNKELPRGEVAMIIKSGD